MKHNNHPHIPKEFKRSKFNLPPSKIKTLIRNEFEASDRHHLLKAKHLGASEYDRQVTDRKDGKKKWRHRQFLRHRTEMQNKLRNEILAKQDAKVEAEKQKRLLEELELERLREQKVLQRQVDVRAAEAELLGCKNSTYVKRAGMALGACTFFLSWMWFKPIFVCVHLGVHRENENESG